MATPSTLGSQEKSSVARSTSGRRRRSRSAQASSSASSKALSRLIIGTRWRTSANSPARRRPHRPGRRVGRGQLGVVGLELAQLADQGVVVGVGDLRVVVHVVALVVVLDQLPQLDGPGRGPPVGRSPDPPRSATAQRGDARAEHRVGVGRVVEGHRLARGHRALRARRSGRPARSRGQLEGAARPAGRGRSSGPPPAYRRPGARPPRSSGRRIERTALGHGGVLGPAHHHPAGRARRRPPRSGAGRRSRGPSPAAGRR